MSSDPDIFNDSEPEDAWDIADPFPILADNLLRRLALLDHDHVRAARIDLLDIIGSRLALYQHHRAALDERDQLRVDQLAEDLAFLRESL